MVKSTIPVACAWVLRCNRRGSPACGSERRLRMERRQGADQESVHGWLNCGMSKNSLRSCLACARAWSQVPEQTCQVADLQFLYQGEADSLHEPAGKLIAFPQRGIAANVAGVVDRFRMAFHLSSHDGGRDSAHDWPSQRIHAASRRPVPEPVARLHRIVSVHTDHWRPAARNWNHRPNPGPGISRVNPPGIPKRRP